jgi:hypothetical protein
VGGSGREENPTADEATRSDFVAKATRRGSSMTKPRRNHNAVDPITVAETLAEKDADGELDLALFNERAELDTEVADHGSF